jgi:DNA helicase-2/ATP-dependent DNA helicase PcrA
MRDIDLSHLDESQIKAVTTEAPVVIIAPAGSGKTTVLTNRLSYWLSSKRLRATETVAITFTRAAAFELRKRLSRSIDGPSPLCTTFHSLSLSILRNHYEAINRQPPRLIDQTALLRRLASELKIANPRQEIQSVIAAKARGIRNLDELDTSEQQLSPAAITLFRAYEKERKLKASLDFSDLLSEATAILESRTSSSIRLKLFYRWVFLDEFQDINRLQLDFLIALLGPELSKLSAVGDPDQAIYGFNGSTLDVISYLTSAIPEHHVVKLSTNYRSTREIVHLASAVLGKQAPHTVKPTGPTPKIRGFTTEDQEYDDVVREVRELSYKGVPLSKISILARTSAQLEPIAKRLTKVGIKHTAPGRGPVASSPVTISLMKKLRNTDNMRSICEIIEANLAEAQGLEQLTILEHLLGLANELRRTSPDADPATYRELVDTYAAAPLEMLNLSTFHKAKGLEWYHVRVIGADANHMPHKLSRAADQVEEERRLAYVAFTRATVSLTISFVGAPSPFLPLESVSSPVPRNPQPFAQNLRASDPIKAALRRWQRSISETRSIPRYQVLSDAEIDAIVRQHPTTLEQLRKCLRSSLASRVPELFNHLAGTIGILDV